MKRWIEPISWWLLVHLLTVAVMYGGAIYFPKPNPDRKYVHAVEDDPSLFPFFRWDADWYLDIARNGYQVELGKELASNVPFFPLYPLLIRGVSALGISDTLAAVSLSHFFFLLSACLLYRLVSDRFGTDSARWSLLFWLLYPFSFFGTAAYSETLTAFLLLLSFFSVERREPLSAGLFVGFASACRVPGVMGALPLLGCWQTGKRARVILALSLSATGVAAYQLYLTWKFGDPFVYHKVQEVWRGSSVWSPWDWGAILGRELLDPFTRYYSGGKLGIRGALFYDPYAFLWSVAWVPLVWRKWGWNYALFVIGLLLLPLFSGKLWAMGRYSWLILPVFMTAGPIWKESRWRWFFLAVFIPLHFWFAFRYAGEYFIT